MTDVFKDKEESRIEPTISGQVFLDRFNIEIEQLWESATCCDKCAKARIPKDRSDKFNRKESVCIDVVAVVVVEDLVEE